ncbi:MAG TPA: tetratricopeptide repeat protein [Terracidiphilus sp.]|nr:tetratricopeptide repeat protein [Terracidiphilus sp.]
MLNFLLYPFSLVLEILAIVHFIRRRPDMYWIYIIVFLGPVGSLVYLFVVAIPDLGLMNNSFRGISRRKRIDAVQAMVEDNPSAGNYEELGELYMDEGNFPAARVAFDQAIAGRSDTTDTFYHRGLCAMHLGDPAAAIPDLERVVKDNPAHDFHRAEGMLAQAYAQSGQKERAEALFLVAVNKSTLSETYLNFADLLASQGRTAEARQWAQKVLNKERTMPNYLRRRERTWFQRAGELLKRLPA